MKNLWFKFGSLLKKVWSSKQFRIMRLSIIIFMIGIIQVLATNTYSQTARLSLDLKDVTVKKVLEEIEDHSEFFFLYSSKLVDVERKISMKTKNKKINSILSDLFAEANVNFLVMDRQIILTPVQVSEKPIGDVPNRLAGKISASLESQQNVVTGKVTDPDGNPLPGVNILIKGTITGTITDTDGNYRLEIEDPDAVLAFSFIGYTTQEISVEGRSLIDATLAIDVLGLDEVVVVGYGTMKKSDLTGAVSNVDVEALSELPNVSVIQALQGNVAGLNIGITTSSGENPILSIRGQNTLSSLSSDNAPLIVVDGTIYRGDLIDLNTLDIKSVDILKDISSAAIYGSQSSNGVLLITTKKSGLHEKPIINYSGQFTLQVPTNNLEPMDRSEYEDFFLDCFWAQGSRLEPDYLQKNPDFKIQPFLGPEVSEAYDRGENNDWWNSLTGNGYINNHNISIRGRTSSLGYYVSAGMTDVKGFIVNDTYKKFNYRANINATINNYFNVGMESFLTSSDYSGVSPTVEEAFTMQPFAPIYDEYGDYSLTPQGWLNPHYKKQIDDSDKRLNLWAKIHADIKLPFLEGFNYRLNFSQNYRTSNHDNFNPWGANYRSDGYKNSYMYYDWALDNIFTYNKEINNTHKFNFTFVYGAENSQYSYTNIYSSHFDNNILGYNSLEAGNPILYSPNTGKEKETSLYMMGRLFYNLQDKYMLTGTIRRDGFSGFGSDLKLAVFPSVAVGWVVSEESFFKDRIEKFNYLKLRGSYGSAGRRGVGRYDTRAIVSTSPVIFGDGGEPIFAQWISKMANNELGWETTTGINVGADFGFFNSRLNGSFEYYNNNTKDILYNIQLPQITGFSSIATNIGEVHNHGIEFTVSGEIIKTSDFRWMASVNYSRNRNEIVSIIGPSNDQDLDGKEDDLVADGLFIGEPQNVNYDYEIIGMWQLADKEADIIPNGFAPGQYKIKDQNNDGEYSASDDRIILGYPDPGYRFGISNTLKYKNFTLYVFINSIQGGKNYYQKMVGPAWYWQVWVAVDDNNAPAGSWDYWMPENPNAKYRRLDVGSTLQGYGGPYEQRNFIRLQNVSLSYTFDKGIIEKWGVSNMKVFLSGKNLYTLTKWEGWDPEAGVGLAVGPPVLANYTLGLNVEF